MHLIHIVLIIAILVLIYIGNSLLIQRIENIEDFIVAESRQYRSELRLINLISNIEKAKQSNNLLENEIFDAKNVLSDLKKN